jgi:uncharacterized membrane protein YcaP (DUF421 family)
MEFGWIWKAILIVLGGTILLRIAGRKSIAQMTLAQTVIMVGIGSLLVQPVANKNIWVALGIGGVLILTLIAMEWGQLKFNFLEKFITGKALVLGYQMERKTCNSSGTMNRTVPQRVRISLLK